MVVLLDPQNGEYYALDEIGGLIWQLCDGTRTVDGIARRLCEEYDVEPGRMHADLVELLNDLADARLIAFESD